VAQWFHDIACDHRKFDAGLVDLTEFNLPVYDEPHHPTLQKYMHEHTKRWSASVAAADAYVFVTPEYNYCPPPPFVNALDYVYREWNYKPCGFVSYGGASGGVRAVQLEKQLVTTLKMVPMVEGVAIANVTRLLDESATLRGTDAMRNAGTAMLHELLLWAEALRPLRERVKAQMQPLTSGTEQ
jgi:NAD(P)H-dependent FMN reductase